MGWFGFGKKAVAAEILGNNIMAMAIDADDCWEDVCALRSYETSGPIATCEMAFARAALVKSILLKQRVPAVADRIVKAADGFVLDAFADQDTDESRTFYGEKMQDVALRRVAFYSQHVFPFTQLASVLGAKLGVPGHPAIEAAFMFERVDKRVRELISKFNVV